MNRAEQQSRLASFFSVDFRVYRRGAFLANMTLAAAVAYSVTGHWAEENLSFTPKPPDSPEITQSAPSVSPALPSLPKTATRLPDTPALASLPAGPETPAFHYQDYQGLVANNMRVAHASVGPGVVIREFTAEMFDVPDAHIDRETHDAIERASDLTGVPKGVLYAFASKESNFVKTASARTSSAQGLMQFTDDTWRNVIKKLGPALGFATEAGHIHGNGTNTWFSTRSAERRILKMRDDVNDATLMAAALMLDDQKAVSSQIGRDLRLDEYYVTHFLGSGNAATFLKNLDRNPHAHVNTVGSMRKPIRANRSIFVKNGRYRTFQESMDWFSAVMSKRIAYYTLKYDSDNVEHMKFATKYARDLGILERHETKPTEDENEPELMARNDERFYSSGF